MRRARPVLTRHTPPVKVIVSRWERLILPFAGSGGAVAQFLVGAVALGLRSTQKRRLLWPPRDERT